MFLTYTSSDSLISTSIMPTSLNYCTMLDANSSLPGILGTSFTAADIFIRLGGLNNGNQFEHKERGKGLLKLGTGERYITRYILARKKQHVITLAPCFTHTPPFFAILVHPL